MKIGVPKEIKEEEMRVAITPAGVTVLAGAGHTVLVEHNAGVGSGISDEEYKKAGAAIVSKASDAWGCEMVMKVKEPLPEEYGYLRSDLVLFTYLHLAASQQLTDVLLASGVVAIAYETIQLPDRSLPLLSPMSEVAGRLSIQAGAHCLEASNGGMGILISGVSGVKPAEVIILGAGVAGNNACHVAAGMGAHVTILDIDPAKLRYISDIMRGRITTLYSNEANIEESLLKADLVVGTVLRPGAKAPKLVNEGLVKRMKKGSAVIDVAVDQGGCIATTKATTHARPTYIMHGVVHYAVANMPGAVPRTSTFALTNVTLSYELEIANKGWEKACRENHSLYLGVNTAHKKLTYQAVADSFSYEYSELKL
jgi:alanine dehydrogenase